MAGTRRRSCLKIAGNCFSVCAFANVDHQRRAADVGRILGQFGEFRDQPDGQIVHRVVAQIFEGLENRGLARTAQPGDDDKFGALRLGMLPRAAAARVWPLAFDQIEVPVGAPHQNRDPIGAGHRDRPCNPAKLPFRASPLPGSWVCLPSRWLTRKTFLRSCRLAVAAVRGGASFRLLARTSAGGAPAGLRHVGFLILVRGWCRATWRAASRSASPACRAPSCAATYQIADRIRRRPASDPRR